ncbi:MAG TPA: hypothetical protein VMI15_04710 [Burkholderiales bacterium]|nr:hypothetical protein [Burkholderiales bacterium]
MVEETLLLPDDARLELTLRSPSHYRLACVRRGRVLVEYRAGDGRGFQSVEKLRYDFQRDVEEALAAR